MNIVSHPFLAKISQSIGRQTDLCDSIALTKAVNAGNSNTCNNKLTNILT